MDGEGRVGEWMEDIRQLVQSSPSDISVVASNIGLGVHVYTT